MDYQPDTGGATIAGVYASLFEAPLALVETEIAPQWPPSVEDVIAGVRQTWPEDPDRAVRVVYCESKYGTHVRTYDLEAANGGPMQINRFTWKWYFEAYYGWSWDAVVADLQTHLAAARIIYDSSGWSAWSCGRS